MPQNSQVTLDPKGSHAPVDRKMYSPSAKHAPHSESPLSPDTTLVGSDDGDDVGEDPTPPPLPLPLPLPQNGSAYACSTIFDASVMYHAVDM